MSDPKPEVRYIAIVTGDRPPYKWEVRKVADGTSTTLAQKGTADTREAALDAATEYATLYEHGRRHAATREEVCVLEVFPPPNRPQVDLEAIPVQDEMSTTPDRDELLEFMD